MQIKQPFSVESWPRAIAHIDADAFFVECERVVNPELKGRCVVVGRERGIVTALSYEAKHKGIKRGMRMFEAKTVCPSLIVIESDYEKYSMFSTRMFDILRKFSPIVEEYSIDEAFIELTGLRRLHSASYYEITRKIQDEIEKQLSISVSIGVATTKILAKVASKYKKPHGIVAIKAKEIHEYIKDILIEEICGIGKNTSSLLRKLGINTALDFALKNEYFLCRYLSKPYIQIWHELRGDSVMPLSNKTKSSYKSISKARSFLSVANDRNFLFAELLKNLENVCAKARRFSLAANKLCLFLKTGNFQTSSIEVKLKSSTAFPLMLTDILRQLFEEIFDENIPYRQTGVILLDLTSRVQYDLFDNEVKINKITHLYKAVDILNKRFGRNSVHLASSSVSRRNSPDKPRLNMPFLEIDV